MKVSGLREIWKRVYYIDFDIFDPNSKMIHWFYLQGADRLYRRETVHWGVQSTINTTAIFLFSWSKIKTKIKKKKKSGRTPELYSYLCQYQMRDHTQMICFCASVSPHVRTWIIILTLCCKELWHLQIKSSKAQVLLPVPTREVPKL